MRWPRGRPRRPGKQDAKTAETPPFRSKGNKVNISVDPPKLKKREGADDCGWGKK